jgi:hypothetical protein
MVKDFGYLIFFYLMFVLLSFLVLTGLYDDFRRRMPYMADKRWKRILWLTSCLAFIPLIIFLVQLPFFVLGEMKRFIKGSE